MATGDNPTIPLFEPGTRVSAAVTAAVVSGTFVKVSASLQGGPLLSLSAPLTGGNLIQVAPCTAAAKAFGVALWDAASAGDVVATIRHGSIVPMLVGAGTVTAGQEVECDAAGKPITLASGRPCGYAVSTGTVGNPVYIALY
jgi:hypothetical protein